MSERPRKQVTVHEADKISFPNVVTPNGDLYNEHFVIGGNTTIISLRIVNRYGKLIFSGSRPENWNVAEVTPSVYFAAVTYRTCEGTVSQMKGLVQVLK